MNMKTKPVFFKLILKNYLMFCRLKSLSSHDWLKRREKDVYVELAKSEKYRCRSAFKLLEIDKRYKILKPGMVSVDIGAAPGSWTQVLVNKTNADGKDEGKPKGTVIGVDRQLIQPIEGAILLCKTDFMMESSRAKIREVIGDKRVDLVVSDMAPNASGVRSLDQEAIFNLALMALQFSILTLAPNSSCLIKLWDGAQRIKLEDEMRRFFMQVNHIRPQATQTDSTELFLLARGFRGLKSVQT